MATFSPSSAISCPPRLRRPALAILLFVAALTPALRAQITLYWDGDGVGSVGGGTGTWNTTLTRWHTALNFSNGYQAWNNASNNDADFRGTAGTVTLGTAITARSLTFQTSGYTIAGNTLTLAGGTGAINTGSGTQTISSIIAGSSGLTKSGTGTLILSGSNIYTGVTTVSAGTLQIGAGVAPPVPLPATSRTVPPSSSIAPMPSPTPASSPAPAR